MSDPAQVRIVNNALGHLGQEPVTDLEDASLAGLGGGGQADAGATTRPSDTVLATATAGSDALKYVTLTAVPDLPAKLAVSDRLPRPGRQPARVGDRRRAGELAACAGSWGPRWQVGKIEAGDAARWIIRASKDACSGGTLDSLNIAYVRKANWASFSAHLADAISYEAAVRAAYSITGEQPSATLTKRAAEQIMVAIGIDGTQEGGQPPAAPSIPAAIRNMSR
jgi:hypothetical protein